MMTYCLQKKNPRCRKWELVVRHVSFEYVVRFIHNKPDGSHWRILYCPDPESMYAPHVVFHGRSEHQNLEP